MKSKQLGFNRTQTEVWLTFMWRDQQVNSLLRQVGPDSVYLPLQVNVAQMLCQDPWGGPANMSNQICSTVISTIHINIRAGSPPARDSGFYSFNLSPDASLISRAVRIRAISVEVKCTVLSSAMGMFILTNR